MSTNSSQPSQAEMGAALSAAAYAQPPIKPHGLALRIIIVIWITTVIATIVVGLRIYVRAWMMRKAKLWGWEDTFAVLGYVSLGFSLAMMTARLVKLKLPSSHYYGGDSVTLFHHLISELTLVLST